MSTNTMVNHYEVLHLPEDALPSDIEAGYRVKLAKIKARLGSSHPLPPDYLDKVREAYRVLSDVVRREAYDRERELQSERWELPMVLAGAHADRAVARRQKSWWLAAFATLAMVVILVVAYR